jgi:pyruvate/2-oxoglutarate dehydrogenase complex dihydrolipoamide acyltransferase (E2) component
MPHTARYAVTYIGNGVVRLPRAGIFQTGTRAVVDETIARIAVAHGSFAVEPLTADAPLVAAAPPPAAPEPPAAAPEPARAPVDERRGRRQRATGAVRVQAAPRSEAQSQVETRAADAHTR